MPEEPKTYSVAEAGKELGLTRGRLYQLIWDGKIKADRQQITKTVLRIPQAEIDRLKAEKEGTP